MDSFNVTPEFIEDAQLDAPAYIPDETLFEDDYLKLVLRVFSRGNPTPTTVNMISVFLITAKKHAVTLYGKWDWGTIPAPTNIERDIVVPHKRAVREAWGGPYHVACDYGSFLVNMLQHHASGADEFIGRVTVERMGKVLADFAVGCAEENEARTRMGVSHAEEN